MLTKMTVLGLLLISYGGITHLRKNETARNFILRHLPESKHEKFLDLLAPKSSIDLEKAKADLKKIRSVDEACADESTKGHIDCRMSDRPRLADSVPNIGVEEKSTLGKALKEMKAVEQAKFDEFNKIDQIQ